MEDALEQDINMPLELESKLTIEDILDNPTNVAELLSEDDLKKIGIDVCDGYQADKDSLSLLLGVETELHTIYREGENKNNVEYSDVGKNAIKRIQKTLKGITFNKETDAGMSKSQSVGLKKDLIRWAKSIEFDDAQITVMFSNMSELTADIPALEKYINTSTTSDIDSRSLSLIKYYLGRIDALYKQIPYDDVPDMVKGTYVE